MYKKDLIFHNIANAGWWKAKFNFRKNICSWATIFIILLSLIYNNLKYIKMGKFGDEIKKGLDEAAKAKQTIESVNAEHKAKLEKDKQDYLAAIDGAIRPAFKEIVEDFKKELNVHGKAIINSNSLPDKYKFKNPTGYIFDINQKSPMFVFAYSDMNCIYLHVVCQTKSNLNFDEHKVFEYLAVTQSDVVDFITECYSKIRKN